LARGLLPVQTATFLQGFRVGDALWLSIPSDFSGELALSLKAAAREHGLAAVVTSFNVLEWQGEPRLVGRLHAGERGPAVCSACAPDWLMRPGTFSIDPTTLPLRAGAQHSAGLFGTLQDCGPDRWGQILVERAIRKKELTQLMPGRHAVPRMPSVRGSMMADDRTDHAGIRGTTETTRHCVNLFYR
jgi:hypothetical protein